MNSPLTPERRIAKLEEECKQLALEKVRLEFENQQLEKKINQRLTPKDQRTKFLAQCMEGVLERSTSGVGALLTVKFLNEMRRDAIIHLDREASHFKDYEERLKKFQEGWEYDSIFGEILDLLVKIECDREELKEYE